MSSVTAVYTSLSLISLCALVGAGVAVGSGVGMMAMQMEEIEQKGKVAAASPKETSFRPTTRGFAASGSA